MTGVSRPLQLCLVSLTVLTFVGISYYPATAAKPKQDRAWHDTGRTIKATSKPTKNNDNVPYGSNCEAADPEGKWCASIVTIVLEITNQDDPEQLTRLKWFDPGSKYENCYTAVRTESGPRDWNQTIDCKFSPALRRFELRIKGWTKPQTFTSEITVQEREKK